MEGRALLAATITVNSALDTNSRDSVVTLREAILINNRSLLFSALTADEKAQVSGTPLITDSDTIAFNIPGTGVQTITPSTALPIVIETAFIDGYTQPGAAQNTSATGWNGILLVELNGSNLNNVNGLVIGASRSTVRGLVINRFVAAPNVSAGAGILLSPGTTQSVVTGNILGADASGTIDRGNTAGVAAFTSAANTIGGTSAGARNIISGNVFGVAIAGAGGNLVRGNYIGTTAAGTAALGNQFGVQVQGIVQNTIGGTAAGAGNVISGNTSVGVWLTPGSKNTQVQGNFVGTDATGKAAVGNDVGVFLHNAEETDIGGTDAGAGNLISGNTSHGIRMASDEAFGQSTRNSIRGNRIGTDVSGTLPLGNARGISIANDTFFEHYIGGTSPNEGNIIAFNTSEGINIEGFPAERISILGNSIFSNGRLGIDLCTFPGQCGDGMTPNGLDHGPNNLQDFPDISFAHLNDGLLTLRYFVGSTARFPLRIEFFKADADGQEGQTYLGFSSYSAAFVGSPRTFSMLPAVALAAGDRIVATATDSSGNTSEFSAAVTVSLPPCSTVVVNTSDTGAGSLREAIKCANIRPGLDTISFNIPVAGVQTISPATALPAINEAVFIDGYSQPGAVPNTNAIDDPNPSKRGLNGTLLIQLSGPSVPVPGMNGLMISSNGSVVRGLVINGFGGSGIVINGGDNNQITGNYIGTDATGSADAGNGNSGLQLNSGAAQNFVGTYGAGFGDAAKRNLISGNSFAGVSIVGFGSDGNWVAGNLIGTNGAGTAIVGNGNRGIEIYGGAKGNLIGTSFDGAQRNVISGNMAEGVGIYEPGTSGNIVTGNWIGTDVRGADGLPNVLGGVVVFDGARFNTIGGLTPAASNTIAFNLSDGVAISGETTKNNQIRGNVIFGNGELGIDLDPGGVTANDVGDADTGANDRQNFPEIIEAVLIDGMLHVTYSVPSLPANSAYPLSIEFFKADSAGHVGEVLVGRDTFDEGDHARGSKTVMFFQYGLLVSNKIVATATEAGWNTSEFSASTLVQDGEPRRLIVTNTLDSGRGSLRDAILYANATANIDRDGDSVEDPDRITFNIAGTGVQTISPLSALPWIIDPVVIDGYTQPGAIPNSSPTGWNGKLLIEIEGSSAGSASGLLVFTGLTTIRGLVINRFRNIDLEFTDGNGIFLAGLPGNVVEGNFIGIDPSGTTRRGNSTGIFAGFSAVATIGGPTPAARNVISGNDFHGVDITESSGTWVLGNFIGTDSAGTTPLANGGAGVSIFGGRLEAGPNMIGGEFAAARNVISGNFGFGVHIQGGSSALVQGNSIGTDLLGTLDLGNDSGVVVDQSSFGNLIGGRLPVAGNVISFNAFSAVDLGNGNSSDGIGNTVLGNSMYANESGINLGYPRPLPNDPEDPDGGANNRQNHPEILYATQSGGELVVTYRVDSLPGNSSYPLRVEFFQTGVIAAGFPGSQGETLIGVDTFTEEDYGAGIKTATIPAAAPVVIDGFVGIVGTATDSAFGELGNTSEFSPEVVISSPWHNRLDPFDVRGSTSTAPDGNIDAGDALAIINYLNAFDLTEVPGDAVIGGPFGFLDPTNDNNVAPDDALSIINAINAIDGEGEASQGTGVRGQESGIRQQILEPRALREIDSLIALLAHDTAIQSSRRRRG